MRMPSPPTAPAAQSWVTVRTRGRARWSPGRRTHTRPLHTSGWYAAAVPVRDHTGDERDQRTDAHDGENCALVGA